MTCWTVKRKSTDYVDGRLRDADRRRVDAHLGACGHCDNLVHDFSTVRSSLQDLPKAASPQDLRTRLRLVASQERRLILEADGSRLRLLWRRWRFELREMMRPLTIPATGGVCSSLILFGALAFTIGTTTRGLAYEVPVLYSTKLDANLVPVELRSSTVLKMSLDSTGRITDYTFHNGCKSVVGNPATLQRTSISVPEISSVMEETHPTSSDIQISFTPMDFRR